MLIGNDDNPSIGLSGFTYALLTGTNYYFVGTGFANTDSGAFTLSVRGPGTVTFNGAAVPEPGTWALMLIGFGAIGVSVRRRRQTARARTA